MATIKWYKVKCSFYKQTIGFKTWQDIIDFMSKNIGFDYIIEGQYSEPFVGVDAYYGLSSWADNLIDACYEMILKLHERKML